MAQIVVIEDNPDNLKLFRAVLRRHGHEVLEFVTGVGVVDALRGIEPDLVLLDLQLPDRDGFQVAADLRADRGPRLRIVALTANVLPEDRERALAGGFDGFIPKPIDVARFPTEVANAVAGKGPEG